MIGEKKKDFSKLCLVSPIWIIERTPFFKEELINRYKPKDVIINYMGATMGTYAGRGGMIVSFY